MKPGDKLGPYEILSMIGAGGMGQVWKARDTRLHRIVAVKVSRAKFSDRFHREARAVAALNHPNICQLYDVGPEYLVMEFVEGAPVAPTDASRKLLDIAVQLSEGLAAAHAAGIVHRDLKPDNILITREGRVKILDFGLAKAASEEIAVDEPTRTMDQALTDPGTTVGTIAYMSPEQARGQTNLTAQSDQFSLGLVLYELAAGKRPFQRGSAAETMSAIIRDDAEPLPASVPAPLHWIVERLLAKEPAERYDSTRDLYRELRQVRERLSESVPTSVIQATKGTSGRADSWRLLAGIGVAAALFGAAITVVVFMRRETPAMKPIAFLPLTFNREIIDGARFTGDGKTVVYDSTPDTTTFHLRSVQPGNPEWRDLNIEGKLSDVSKSGEMALIAGNILSRAPVGGGAPRAVADGIKAAAWSPDGSEIAVVRTVGARDRLEYPIGKVLFESAGSLDFLRVAHDGQSVVFLEHQLRGDYAGSVMRVSITGKAVALTRHFPSLVGLALSPSGSDVLFTESEGMGVTLYAVGEPGKARTVLTLPEYFWLEDSELAGDLLFVRTAGRISLHRSLRGAATEQDLSWHDGGQPADISADGRELLFAEGASASTTDFETYVRGTDGSQAVHLGLGLPLSLSAAGKWALVSKNIQFPAQLFLLPTGIGEARQATRDSIHHEGAAFLPGGQAFVFAGYEPGHPRRYFVQDLKGGTPRAFGPEGVAFDHMDQPVALSPDGKVAALTLASGQIFLQPVDGSAGRLLLQTETDLVPLRWCPDGSTMMTRKKIGSAMEIDQVNIASGKRTLWRSIAAPTGSSGVSHVDIVRIAPDCQSAVWSVETLESRLFLVRGVL